MKKILLPLSFVLNCLTLGYIFINVQPKNQPTTQETTNTPRKKVIILSPALHPSLNQIEQGTISSLKKYLPGVVITTMNANGKKTLMLAQVQEALSSKPDAIVTIGSYPTQLMREFTKKRNSKVLHVFTAVSTPEKFGVVYNPQDVTGVQEKSDYVFTSSTLNYLTPSLRSLLLVYNPGDGNNLELERQALEVALQVHGIRVTPLEVFQASEISHKIKSLIAQHDAVIILKDNTVVSGIDSLVKVCEQNNKMLITHNLDSAEKGAAISFGAHEKDFGLTAGKIVADGLLTKQPLPPIYHLNANHVKINTAAAKRQNLQLKPIEITLFKSIIIT